MKSIRDRVRTTGYLDGLHNRAHVGRNYAPALQGVYDAGYCDGSKASALTDAIRQAARALIDAIPAPRSRKGMDAWQRLFDLLEG